MGWGFIIFAGGMASIGYAAWAVAEAKLVNKDVPCAWPLADYDPRAADILNGVGSNNLDPGTWGGGRAKRGRGYADKGLHRTHSEDVL